MTTKQSKHKTPSAKRRQDAYTEGLNRRESGVGESTLSERLCFRDGFDEGYNGGREAGRLQGLEEAANLIEPETKHSAYAAELWAAIREKIKGAAVGEKEENTP